MSLHREKPLSKGATVMEVLERALECGVHVNPDDLRARADDADRPTAPAPKARAPHKRAKIRR